MSEQCVNVRVYLRFRELQTTDALTRRRKIGEQSRLMGPATPHPRDGQHVEALVDTRELRPAILPFWPPAVSDRSRPRRPLFH